MKECVSRDDTLKEVITEFEWRYCKECKADRGDAKCKACWVDDAIGTVESMVEDK